MAKKEVTKTLEELREELSRKKVNGRTTVKPKEIKRADEFCEGYKAFLNEVKTEREAVAYTVREAKKRGFTEFDSSKKYVAGDKVYYDNRGRAVCLAVIGERGTKDGVRISAAHIDSPRIDLKPIPLYESGEMVLMKTHYYGGIKKYQWMALPLALHGKIVCRDGREVIINIGEKDGDPQFCITDILPHLGKDQMGKKLGEAFTGEDLNVLVGSTPYNGEEGDQAFKLNILKLLNDSYGIVEEDFISAELEFVPALKAVDVGFDRALIGAYGHDDRVCAYPSVEAIFNCDKPKHTVITVLADKEEVGSMGNTGLDSDFLRFFIADLAEQEGQAERGVLSKTTCLSADVTAAFDPNFASVYESGNSCYINHGIGMTKYTGVRGKAGGSDASAEFVGEIRRLFNKEGIVWQIGELGKVDQGGGGTVAAYVAKFNAEVLDVGVPVLSMHAPFEIVSKLDVYMTYKAIKAYFEAK